MTKRIICFIIAFAMCLGIVPINSVNAEEEEKKLNVIPLDDGSYMIELPSSSGETQLITKRALEPMGAPTEPNTITPETDPDKFEEQWVKTDVADLLVETLGITEVTLIAYSKPLNYSGEYTVKLNGDTSKGEYKIGEYFKAFVPKSEYRPAILVRFPDGRDSRRIVEAKSKPTGFTVNIGFLGHTGVQTKWFGNSQAPSVKAKYTGTSNRFVEFDLPTVNQNSILRIGDRWLWKDHENVVYLQKVSDEIIKLSTKAVALDLKTTIDDKKEGQLGTSNYIFKVTGDALYGFTVTSREKVSVDFDAGKGSWKAPATKPETQYTGHSLTVNDAFTTDPKLGPIKVPNGAKDLTPPDAEAGQPEQEFEGWSDTENGSVVDLNTYNIIKDTTFYAIYKEKAQGKIKVEYQDMNGNTIDDKYKLNGKDYPTELPGNNGEEIKAEHLNGAPEFIGYEYKANATKPVPNPGEKASYTENGKYTLIYKYNKLDSVIPEKDPNGGNDNTKPTGYVTVTFKAGDNGKINGGTADVKFFVNPKDDVKFGDTKISEPTITANDNYDVADTKWSPDFAAKKTETITANAEFTAQYKKQKGTVTYKYNSHVNNTGVQNPDATGIPAVPTDNTQYDVGTTVAAETNIAEANKVTGKTIQVKNNSGTVIGQWTFSGWTPATLTIKKNSPTDKNEFTGTWTFTEAGKQSVTYQFASGTNGETLPTEVTNLLTKQAESKYVNDTVNAPTDTYNDVVISTGNKQGTWTFDGWYAGTTDATKKNQPLTVTEAGPNKFIGVWTFTEKGKKNVTFEFAFYNSKKPTQEIPKNAIGQFKPTLPPAQNNKYVGSDITLPTIDHTEVEIKNGDLQGTWKFDGWYRGDTKLTAANAKVSENDAENKLVGKWILTETETKEVTRVFVIDKDIIGDGKDVPTGHNLPEGVTKQKPNDTTNYLGSTQTPGKDKFNPVEEKIGEKIGNWTFVKWDKDSLVVDADESKNVFTGTWTWEQLTSDKPTVDQPKAEDTVIKGKGKKGSTIVVTTPDGKTHETKVNDNGDWKVTVPPVKENDKIKVEQTEKGKKKSDPVEVTVERKIKYFGHFYEPSPDYLNKGEKPKTHEPKDQTKEKYLEAYRWYVKGNDMGMFMPKKGITRAEVAQMFARALEYDKAMVHTNITPYTDVDANAWYYEAVQKTSAAGIFKGSDKGTFMPTREITKAELIATIARFQHLNTKAGNTMNLQMNHWATSEVEAAYQEGWLDIYTNGTVQFRADEVITRAEVVTILNRAFGRMADAKYIDDNAHTMTNFTDVTKDMWSYYEIMTAANTYLVDKMWVNHATKDNGPETLKEMIEWVKPLMDNKDVREVVEQVRFQR